MLNTEMTSYVFPYDFMFQDGSGKPINIKFHEKDILQAVQNARRKIDNSPKVVNSMFDGHCVAVFTEGTGQSGPMQARVVFSPQIELSICIQIDFKVNRNPNMAVRIAALNYHQMKRSWEGVVPPFLTKVLEELVDIRNKLNGKD